jgi:hypothetical protein
MKRRNPSYPSAYRAIAANYQKAFDRLWTMLGDLEAAGRLTAAKANAIFFSLDKNANQFNDLINKVAKAAKA